MCRNLSVSANEEFRKKVSACWLGKAVGGTLGMPCEGSDGPFDLSFYDPVPTEMIANDDLDLQVVWACVLDKMKEPRVDRHMLASAWLEHVDFAADEYGVALRNLRMGLKPPLTGSYDNWFVQGMGAAIRSELWACLAAGDPELAMAYAYEDACVDHTGEGLWAEVFLAALQAGAFVESHPQKLLDSALELMPEASLVRQAVSDTYRWWTQLHDWREVREKVLQKYEHENFTDVTMNIAFTVLGWLAGEGDFSKAICTAVNCGKDTDCTGATVGALMGILDPDSIGEEWVKPIGQNLVISPEITGIDAPATIDAFTDMVVDLRERLDGRHPEVESVQQSEEGIRGIDAQKVFLDTTIDQFNSDVPEIAADLLEPLALPGNVGEIPYDQFTAPLLLLRFTASMPKTQEVRVLFNTPENCKVWVDGQYAFGRQGGSVVPSFHRAPEHQFCDMELAAGEHEIIAAIEKPVKPRTVKWVVGVGDCKNWHWLLPDVLRQS